MPSHQHQFDQYRIYYMTGGADVPLIDCFNGTAFVGKLVFHLPGAALPPNIVTSSGVIYLRYSIGQFGDVIGILRQEKPLFIRLSTPSGVGYLGTTDSEPVGEEEGSP